MSSELDFLKTLSPQEEGHFYKTVADFVELVEKFGYSQMCYVIDKELNKILYKDTHGNY